MSITDESLSQNELDDLLDLLSVHIGNLVNEFNDKGTLFWEDNDTPTDLASIIIAADNLGVPGSMSCFLRSEGFHDNVINHINKLEESDLTNDEIWQTAIMHMIDLVAGAFEDKERQNRLHSGPICSEPPFPPPTNQPTNG